MRNLTKDFPSKESSMMINNYNNIKEFDVSFLNLTQLDWYVIDGLKEPYPPDDPAHVLDLVVEIELLLVDES